MKVLRPLRAIREYCVECSGHNRAEVERCELDDCTLWPYRMGRRPGTVRRSSKTAKTE